MEIFQYFSYVNFSKYVLEELKYISKEGDDITIKIDRERLNKLINELEKKVDELNKNKNKLSSVKERFRDVLNEYIENLNELKNIINRDHDKYEIVAILNKLEDNLEKTIEISKKVKLSLYGVVSIIFLILSGILSAIIIPTIKHKKKKKKKNKI